MKSILTHTTIIIALLFSLSGSAQNQTFKWHQANMGGGGYITGFQIDPANSNIVYARCDVAGMFKSTDGGKNWKAINNGMMECHHHSVETFAIHPEKTNVLLRCAGEARDHKIIGSIHKSVDGGQTWKEVTGTIDYFGNGPNRMFGEKIAFDPYNPARVVTMGFLKGIFISDNEGNTWEYSSLKDEPAGCIAFHPTVKGRIYAGTLKEVSYGFKNYLCPDFSRPAVGRLFQSDDSGKTWRKIFETTEFEFCDIAFSSDNPDLIIVSSMSNGGIYKSQDGGKSFKRSMDGLPVPSRYNTVSADPTNPKRFFTAPDRRGDMGHIQLVPIYVSNDYGETWQAIKFYNRNDFSNYPGYVRTEEWIGWAISKIKVDPKNSKRILMSNWYGVSVSEDGGKTWNGNNFSGMETSCMEGLTVDPVQPGKVFLILGDHQPNVSFDWGKTWSPFVRPVITPPITRSNTIAPSRFKKGFSVYGGGSQKNPAMLRTFDDGKTYEITQQFEKGLFIQVLREDNFNEGTFYAFIDGPASKKAGIWKSHDWGKTWIFISNPFPEYVQNIPFKRSWIESEVLSVVYYQNKNVCGTNQLFCMDPFRQNTMIVGEWTEGIFISRDGGVSWKDISKGLPFHKNDVSILNCIVADENTQGTYYAGFIREGLWRTRNDGKTWEKVFPVDNAICNATSLVVGGYNADEIFIASEPLYWSKVPSSVFYSKNKGKTWENIYDPSFGALRWKGIAMDRQNGNLYGVTCGNGAFYLERAGK